jgi:hypothetical protein
MKPIIRPIPKRAKEPEGVTWQKVDDFLKEHPFPYVKKTEEGFYDIFDGERHVYCGEKVALKYLDSLKKLPKRMW